jgi:hypothetical protein
MVPTFFQVKTVRKYQKVARDTEYWQHCFSLLRYTLKVLQCARLTLGKTSNLRRDGVPEAV